MFQALFWKRAISLACVLLWAKARGMIIATGGFVNHSEENEIVPLGGCDQCLTVKTHTYGSYIHYHWRLLTTLG